MDYGENIRQNYQKDDSAETSIQISYHTMVIERLFVLEDSSTSEKEEDSITSIAVGGDVGGGTSYFRKFCPHENKNGLVHGNGLHLIKGPLETNGLKEGGAGAAGEQSRNGL
jgi:hypothetical protein